MDSIRDILKDKEFDEKSLNFLENAIKEFEELYGKYVSKEDLIERVKINIDRIQFTDKLDSRAFGVKGCYNHKERKIQVITGMSEEQTKSYFFHEFLHAICTAEDRRNSGFQRMYDIYDLKNKRKVEIGRGFNEGFVNTLTEERNEQFATERLFRSYAILTPAVREFTNLFGREQMIDMHFNNQDGLIDFIYEQTGVSGINFLRYFDIIHEKENQITQRTISRKFGTGLWTRIDQEFYSKKVLDAQERILQVYVDGVLKEKIKNGDEWQQAFEKITNMYNILGKTISVQTLRKVMFAITEEVLKTLPKPDNKILGLFKSGIIFSNFKSLNTSEKVEKLGTDNNKDLNKLFEKLDADYPSLYRECCSLMVNELYENQKDFTDFDMTHWIEAFRGVAKYIIDNNLSFENLKITYNRYDNYGNIFEIYNLCENGRHEQLETLFVGDDKELRMQSCKPIKPSQIKELDKMISARHDVNVVEAYQDDNGNFMIYNEVGQSFIVTDNGSKIQKASQTINNDSINEIKLRAINKKMFENFYRRTENQGKNVPAFVLEKEEKKYIEYNNERIKLLEAIKSASKKKGITDKANDEK